MSFDVYFLMTSQMCIVGTARVLCRGRDAVIAAWRAINSSGGQCDVVSICSKLKTDLLKLFFVVMAWFVAGFDTLASLLSQSDMPLFRAEEAKVCTMTLCYCEYMQSLLSGRHWVSFSVAETKF